MLLQTADAVVRRPAVSKSFTCHPGEIGRWGLASPSWREQQHSEPGFVLGCSWPQLQAAPQFWGAYLSYLLELERGLRFLWRCCHFLLLIFFSFFTRMDLKATWFDLLIGHRAFRNRLDAPVGKAWSFGYRKDTPQFLSILLCGKNIHTRKK